MPAAAPHRAPAHRCRLPPLHACPRLPAAACSPTFCSLCGRTQPPAGWPKIVEAQRRLAANQGTFVHLRGGLHVWLCPTRLAWALLWRKLWFDCVGRHLLASPLELQGHRQRSRLGIGSLPLSHEPSNASWAVAANAALLTEPGAQPYHNGLCTSAPACCNIIGARSEGRSA